MPQVSYATTELKAVCLDLEVADSNLGRTNADKLVTMLADAEAFETAQDWFEFLGDDVEITDPVSFAVRLGPRYKLVFVSVDIFQENGADGLTNWSTVEFIKLVRISGLS